MEYLQQIEEDRRNNNPQFFKSISKLLGYKNTNNLFVNNLVNPKDDEDIIVEKEDINELITKKYRDYFTDPEYK